eukprot:gene13096-biopygen23021
MPDVVQEWHAEDVIFEAFWRILSALWTNKLAKSGLKDAPQRRGYIRSIPMGLIDEVSQYARLFEIPQFNADPPWSPPPSPVSAAPHPCGATVWVRGAVGAAGSPPLGRTSSGGAALWHAEDVIFEVFSEHFWRFMEPKPTKITSKYAPQRRVYARSVQKGPIDGTHGTLQNRGWGVYTAPGIANSAIAHVLCSEWRKRISAHKATPMANALGTGLAGAVLTKKMVIRQPKKQYSDPLAPHQGRIWHTCGSPSKSENPRFLWIDAYWTHQIPPPPDLALTRIAPGVGGHCLSIGGSG